MKLTRLSLIYLVTYLCIGGIAFMANPSLALKLFFSTGTYDLLTLRLLGVPLFSLGLTVVGIYYYKAEDLYPVTLWVRSFIFSAFVVFYIHTGDPLYLTLICIVGLGMLMTGVAYWRERKRA
jgi:hypothetical protein